MSPIPLSYDDKFEEINYCSELQKSAINEITKEFEINNKKLNEIIEHFRNEMNKGLTKHGQTVAMVPSYVTGVPTGKEVGTFLALDLGGTNLRVCQINLEGGGKISVKQQKYKISDSHKTGEARHLFDFIAECVDKFLVEFNIDCNSTRRLNLGFTFSFPVEQTAIDKGTLISWTKGFSASGAAGKDVVFLLQESLNRKEVPVKVSALVNDTVGTLLAHAYKYPNTLLGVIFGTGTNGAYFEKISNIKKLQSISSNADHMIINVEWGAFDNEKKVLPLTMFDNKLDRNSINPRLQIFEKTISGMYLGEITRNVLLNLIDRSLLFNGYSSKDLNDHYSFETEYMSSIEKDDTSTLETVKQILEESLNLPSTTLTDRQIVKRICQLVGFRAARLSSAALSAIISHCNVIESGCNIGIDGSLFLFYPGFKERIMNSLKELFGPNADKIELGLALDGSGVGAGN
ncbi:hexokinase-domain-containing protein [Glomus cerebriforme]|uniref:Phosphotransferase n=1 Tax=Glomus cerebriforme TaxID=658196 RepID=A0A397TMC6_9GLOM|nr:hexokinase-domain-containing protein [Glomus cerebriforme]